MPAKIDLTGQKFNKLTVIKEAPKEQRKNNRVTWICRCDCGKEVLVTGKDLKSGNTKSCGCLYSKNLVGKRYGRLLVLASTEMRKLGSMVWKCQCDCGNICYATTEGLRVGDNKSCGCLKQEKAQELANKSKLNLVGQRFGKLVVLKAIDQRTNQQTQIWECKCDCGNICYVTSNHLTQNNTKSCGCLQNHSYGELKIQEILNENNISYKAEYKFDDLPNRRYDFAIFNKQKEIIQLIEFDGEQHYIETPFFKISLREQQAIDNEKTKFAEQKHIKLVRIPYWKRNNLTLQDLEIDINELSQ